MESVDNAVKLHVNPFFDKVMYVRLSVYIKNLIEVYRRRVIDNSSFYIHLYIF